ncbi:hypothetical protein N0V83_005780 [Neocucurbitaria cava]|uniref:Lysine-specific metallo-endopeptidase domain-containing protein n=1 Tax=Neocucurbitaria cava TaxID=798079 RepID=A0A9W9CME6_9PLEO|nr:hypothetical protein N0V83_005780 [Neocucurbitaria cava]
MFNLLEHTIIFLSLVLFALGTPIETTSVPFTTIQPTGTETTLAKRADPSEYPWADPSDPVHAIIENEFKWFGWNKENEQDKHDGQRIHQAFREWHEFAQAGANDMDDFDSLRFKRWFRGGKEDPVPGPEGVKKTFENMINRNTGVAGPNIAKMVLHREELPAYPDYCAKRPKMNAYTIAESGAFHFCDKGIKLPLNSELNCDDFTESVSGKMKSVSMTILHESTHYDGIDGTDFGIDDEGGNSASKCFEIDGEAKIQNAQNYAWMAADAYWSAKCKKEFVDPPPGTTDNDDTVNIPGDLPSGPTKALTIVAEAELLSSFPGITFGGWETTTWKFFATDYGKTVNCRTDILKEEETQQNLTKQLFPFGVYNFQLYGEACQYRNNGHTTGRLICGDKDIECTVDPGSTNPPSASPGDKGNYKCGDKRIRQPMFTCPY